MITFGVVATKGGVTAFTKALAVDEARHGVRVNAVREQGRGRRMALNRIPGRSSVRAWVAVLWAWLCPQG